MKLVNNVFSLDHVVVVAKLPRQGISAMMVPVSRPVASRILTTMVLKPPVSPTSVSWGIQLLASESAGSHPARGRSPGALKVVTLADKLALHRSSKKEQS